MKEYSIFTMSCDGDEIYRNLNVPASDVLTTLYGDALFEEMSDEDFFEEEYETYNIYNVLDFLMQVECDMDYSWVIVSVDENGRIAECYPSEEEVLKWWKNMIEEETEYRK